MANYRRNKGVFYDLVDNVPTVADLQIGEAVICTADNKMYYRDLTGIHYFTYDG